MGLHRGDSGIAENATEHMMDDQLRELGAKVPEGRVTAPCATTVATRNGRAARTRAHSAGHHPDGHAPHIADLHDPGAAGVPRRPFFWTGVSARPRCECGRESACRFTLASPGRRRSGSGFVKSAEGLSAVTPT
jgi:hypothetical protein